MILLIELGNSTLKWALLNIDEARGEGVKISYGTPAYYLNQEPRLVFAELLSEMTKPKAVLVASVADDKVEEVLSQWIDDYWGVPLDFIETAKSFDELRNGYEDPAQLGVDRWLNLVAAWVEFGGPLCVVDCGTAVTMDMVDKEGQHLGGLIIPGIDMMMASLEDGTAGCILNSEECEEEAESLLAQNTTQAIIGGSIYAIVAFIDRMMDEIFNELDEKTPIHCVITGGNANVIEPLLNWTFTHRPNLSLDGLMLQSAVLADSAET